MTATGRPTSITYRIVLPGRPIKHVFQHMRVEPEGGTSRRATGTIQDVTEREVAAQERAALETQLRHAQRLEALGTLAAGIAHDFNNLLTVIGANVELARMPGGAVRESLDAINDAGSRAADLVRQILTIGRRQPTRMTRVSPTAVAEEALRLLRSTWRDVEIVANLSPPAPAVEADATQLSQVLMNLCTNAWQALEGQRGRIEVSVREIHLDEAGVRGRPRLSPGPHVEITVSDSGIGMDEATIQRVFDPFFTTKPQGVGSGLGLSVVHGIVESHSGTIDVVSEPGKGSTFRVLLPAALGATAAPTRTPAEPSAPARLSVMLVDDEPAILSVLGRSLESAGFAVECFDRAEEALAAFGRDPAGFDVLVTDQRMPGISGLELAAEVRRLSPELAVVLMSGNLDDRVMDGSARAGVREVVQKPCTVRELRAAIVAASDRS